MRSLGIFGIALLALTNQALGQQQSPYVEYQGRSIMALSAEQIGSYLAGDGMGFALAAELNGYPGPRHVLELAEHAKASPGPGYGSRRSGADSGFSLCCGNNHE